MKTPIKVARIVFEVVGGLAILLCGYIFYTPRGTMRAGKQQCAYTQVADQKSPDGKVTAEKRLETCPYGTWVQVYLKTDEDESEVSSKIISLQKVNATQIDLRWSGPRELEVSIPKNAVLLQAYSFFWDVEIKRHIRD